MTTRKEEAGGGNPPARTLEQQPRYRWTALSSRANRMEQAAEVLLMLAIFPVSTTTKVAMTALLARRVERAYGGSRR